MTNYSQQTLLDTAPMIMLHIPGCWQRPADLADRLPEGYQLTSSHLVLPDGQKIEYTPKKPDDQFFEMFQDACLKPASSHELDLVERYCINVNLVGTGGSCEAAQRMLTAAAAIVSAGAGGVFVDNSAIAHGSADWIAMAESQDPDGAYWAFVTTVVGKNEVYSLGAHALGMRDAVTTRTDDDLADHLAINNFLGYMFELDQIVSDGDLLGDEEEAMFRICKQDFTRFKSDSPLFNPYGQWYLKAVDATAN